VLLTWNEEANVAACLASLARQRRRDFEVILVDAASQDRTLAIVEDVRRGFPMPLRVEASRRKLPIGEARNLGVALARAPFVAFVSADAELDEAWVEEALASLEQADMVFGPQLHEPHTWTVGAAVRGLRYHFPTGPTSHPLRYASNVAAAYRRELLLAFPFDAWANAAEDLLLARRAAASGFRALYNPRMVVRHHDVATGREEMRKSVREGHGWGAYSDELGLFLPILAWAAGLAWALVLLALYPGPLPLALLVLLLWLPALRRAMRRRQAMPAAQIAKGVAASPLFDLAFLFHYVRGLLVRGGRRKTPATPQENRA
jgi:glycosyltransferase involved in cell wall biosynthesis